MTGRSAPSQHNALSRPLALPCGHVLKNRLAKAAMSDSLGDGLGHPTAAQASMYARWAAGGLALSIIGEVQSTPHYAEKPGNLVLHPGADLKRFEVLAQAGAAHGAALWLQLGHAGAMADPAISAPKGPSALDLPGLTCGALDLNEIGALPAEFARTAALAQTLGFGGVEIHAAHGFLLSQFLSPLSNRRTDAYGGALAGRVRLTLEVIAAVRRAVGPDFPLGIKINATDQLEGGLSAPEALDVVRALDQAGVDLIDVSGGTYFPGAASASDRAGGGPYFLDFARDARARTDVPLMVTGGFKTYQQAAAAITDGTADLIGLGRALILDPDLPGKWTSGAPEDPAFPRFDAPPEGGVTAWYTMQITQLANAAPPLAPEDLPAAMARYADRDSTRSRMWNETFGQTRTGAD